MFGSPPAAARDADPETGGNRLPEGAQCATEGTRQSDPAPGLGAGCKWGAGVERTADVGDIPLHPPPTLLAVLGPGEGRGKERTAGSLLSHVQGSAESRCCKLAQASFERQSEASLAAPGRRSSSSFVEADDRPFPGSRGGGRALPAQGDGQKEPGGVVQRCGAGLRGGGRRSEGDF